jgi:hypothetical protein
VPNTPAYFGLPSVTRGIKVLSDWHQEPVTFQGRLVVEDFDVAVAVAVVAAVVVDVAAVVVVVVDRLAVDAVVRNDGWSAGIPGNTMKPQIGEGW